MSYDEQMQKLREMNESLKEHSKDLMEIMWANELAHEYDVYLHRAFDHLAKVIYQLKKVTE